MLRFLDDKVLEARTTGIAVSQYAADREEGIPVFFGREPPPVGAPEERVVGIDRGVGRVIQAGTPVGSAGHQGPDDRFQGLLGIVAKLRRQLVEQFWMGRLHTHPAEVIRAGDQSLAKGPLPDPVDDGTPEQRILRGGEILSQRGARLAFFPTKLRRCARPQGRSPRNHHGSGRFDIAPVQEPDLARLALRGAESTLGGEAGRSRVDHLALRQSD